MKEKKPQTESFHNNATSNATTRREPRVCEMKTVVSAMPNAPRTVRSTCRRRALPRPLVALVLAVAAFLFFCAPGARADMLDVDGFRKPCDYVCHHGACVYENCADASCPGGGCTFTNSLNPSCRGGACVFDRCAGAKCEGGRYKRLRDGTIEACLGTA